MLRRATSLRGRVETFRLDSEALRGNRTVLLCTHDLEEARRLTSQVAVLAAGRLVASGPTDAVLCGDDPHALFRPGEDIAS